MTPEQPATVHDTLVSTAVHQANKVDAPTTMDVIFRNYMQQGAPPVAGYTYYPGIDSRKVNSPRYTLG